MKNLMKLTFLSLYAFFSFNAKVNGQGVNLSVDPIGVGVVGKMYNGATGSPYLSEDWSQGSVKLQDGTLYQGLNLKYDLIKDELIFSLDKNHAKAFMYPVKEFTIIEGNDKAVAHGRIFRNGFPAVDGNNEKSYYEVLADGKYQLLKRTSKDIVEERAPGATFATKQIKPTVRYYMTTPTGLVKVRKDKKGILAVLKDKSTEIAKFAENNNLSFKEDEDLAKLVTYYNSLN